MEEGYTYGVEDIHLDDHGYATGHNSACGDVIKHKPAANLNRDNNGEGEGEDEVFAEIYFDDVDLTDVFYETCDDPSEAISARIQEQIDKEVEKLINQAVSSVIKDAMCNMINL